MIGDLKGDHLVNDDLKSHLKRRVKEENFQLIGKIFFFNVFVFCQFVESHLHTKLYIGHNCQVTVGGYIYQFFKESLNVCIALFQTFW